MDMAIAKALDANAIKSRMARELFIAYLGGTDQIGRGRASGRWHRPTSAYSAASRVVETLRTSSFSLRDVDDGTASHLRHHPAGQARKPQSPAQAMGRHADNGSHAQVCDAAVENAHVIDECAPIRASPTAAPGYYAAARQRFANCWTSPAGLEPIRQVPERLADDPQQRGRFAGLSESLIDNMAREWSELLGVPAEQLAKLPREDAVVFRREREVSSVGALITSRTKCSPGYSIRTRDLHCRTKRPVTTSVYSRPVTACRLMTIFSSRASSSCGLLHLRTFCEARNV